MVSLAPNGTAESQLTGTVELSSVSSGVSYMSGAESWIAVWLATSSFASFQSRQAYQIRQGSILSI